MSTTPQAATQEAQAMVRTGQTSPLIIELSTSWKMSASTMIDTLKATVFPQKDRSGNQIIVSNAQLMMFLQVCHVYSLNPFIKEIYAFPTKGGGIVPMVPIDGWANIVNRNAQMDGMDFVDEWVVPDTSRPHEKSLFSTTCIIYRKDRSHPTRVTEYMQECLMPDKDTWRKWPARMLRHKALIQCARIAFSLAGIYDPDEAERIAESEGKEPQAISRPSRVIEGKTESAAQPVLSTGHDAGGAAEAAGVSGPAGSQAPAAANCHCSCCKNGMCNCLTREEFDRCGCGPCKEKVAGQGKGAVEQSAQQAGAQQVAAQQQTISASQPSGNELFPEQAKSEPSGPYISAQRIKKVYAVARGAGLQVDANEGDTDQLHKILKERFNIASVKRIPEIMLDEVLKAVGGDRLKLK